MAGKAGASGRRPGSKNKRSLVAEAAMNIVREKLGNLIPDAFDGDAVAYLQSVYRDPSYSSEERRDAAKAAARFERPALMATTVKGDAENPLVVQATVDLDSQINELLKKAMGGS